MKWTKVDNAVFTANSSIVKLNTEDLNFLKTNLIFSTDRRIRICAHQTSDEILHDMLIAISNTSYIRPHKHLRKSESFHVIEGIFDVVIFNDDGEVREIIPMGEMNSGRHFFYRLSAPYFHTLFLHSELTVFHETTNGPFIQEETIYPEWAPLSHEVDEIKQFLAGLKIKIKNYLKN